MVIQHGRSRREVRSVALRYVEDWSETRTLLGPCSASDQKLYQKDNMKLSPWLCWPDAHSVIK
jgi:hypothetical protein